MCISDRPASIMEDSAAFSVPKSTDDDVRFSGLFRIPLWRQRILMAQEVLESNDCRSVSDLLSSAFMLLLIDTRR